MFTNYLNENLILNSDKMTPYYDDDGTEIKPDLIPKPDLCLICKKQNETEY